MKCQNVERMLTSYLDGEVSATERAEMEAHLAGCPACAGELADRRAIQRQVGSTLRAVAATATPPPQAWARLQARLATRPGLSWRERLATALVPARPKPRLALVSLTLVCVLAVALAALYPGGLVALAQGGIERLVRVVYLAWEPDQPAIPPAPARTPVLVPLAEAQQQVDFHIYVPTYVPAGLTLVGAEVVGPHKVLIRYEGDGTIRRLDLQQTRLTDVGQPPFFLASPNVVKGTVGGREALWVEGSWPQSVALMIWERDEFAFTMLVSARQPGLSIAEATRIAESLQ